MLPPRGGSTQRRIQLSLPGNQKMRHFIPEIWAAAVIAAAAALAAGRAALHPRLGRYALPLLGMTS